MANADLIADRKPVVGFEGLFEVDDQGRVFTVPRALIASDGRVVLVKAARRRHQVNPATGYCQLTLKAAGKRECVTVHRIVASAFLPKPQCPDQLVVNHINGDRTDNRVTNLEWVTQSQNLIHAYRVLGAKHPMSGKFGPENLHSLPVVAYGADGRVAARFDGMREAQRAGFKAPAISRCISNPGRTHRGMRWELASLPTPEASRA